jgi:hypothetical protein
MRPTPPVLHAVAAFVLALAFSVSSAAAASAPPVFSANASVSWIVERGGFKPPPSGPGPVAVDPAHPAVNADDFRAKGTQPTFPVADLKNPILQPWAREAVREHNALVLSGRPAFSRMASCWPMGVPGFLLYPVQPVYIVQGPRDVVMIWQSDHQVRHIYLDVPHRPHPAPSWYGDSIGHYEGSTLVVDTIGLDSRTFIDDFETPHTDKLHVVERYHLIDGGKTLQVDIHVEDPGAFTTPWNAIQRYRRIEPPKSGKAPIPPESQGGTSSASEPGPLIEASCAENNFVHIPSDSDAFIIPQAQTPDF